MEKSSYRYREESHREKKPHASKVLRGNLANAKVQVQEFVTELGKTMPAIKKFSRENWQMIAMLSAGISVIATGAYIYFNQEKPSPTRNRNH